MSVGTPTVWLVTIAFVAALIVLDFALTRRPHEVSLREAAWWSTLYVALPLSFAVFVQIRAGTPIAGEYLTGYLVEKALSIDNLFVFMLLLSSFAVPPALQQRVLLFGIVGALALRGVLIALGALALERFTVTFLLFGLVLLVTAGTTLRDARRGGHTVDPSRLPSVRLVRRLFPVTDGYRGSRLLVREDGRRHLTPLAVVTAAVLGTDVVFAVDSVPAVYGITEDPYLVFATNAFALLGLRALYFLLAGMLSRLRHLSYGLSAVLALIGVKLALHWAHGVWPQAPQIPTSASVLAIVAVLTAVTVTSLVASRRAEAAQAASAAAGT
jgi:tellurite resistance protein TerC